MGTRCSDWPPFHYVFKWLWETIIPAQSISDTALWDTLWLASSVSEAGERALTARVGYFSVFKEEDEASNITYPITPIPHG